MSSYHEDLKRYPHQLENLDHWIWCGPEAMVEGPFGPGPDEVKCQVIQMYRGRQLLLWTTTQEHAVTTIMEQLTANAPMSERLRRLYALGYPEKYESW